MILRESHRTNLGYLFGNHFIVEQHQEAQAVIQAKAVKETQAVKMKKKKVRRKPMIRMITMVVNMTMVMTTIKVEKCDPGICISLNLNL